MDFNLSGFSRRLWGPAGRSATVRRRIPAALAELLKTRVTLFGVDPYTLEPAEGQAWQMQLLEAAGVKAHMRDLYHAAAQGDRKALVRLGELSTAPAEAKATWSIVFPRWLADSIRRGGGFILDYAVQRELRGSAKRIWIQLEASGGWSTHRLAPADDERALAAVARRLAAGPDITTEPPDGEPAIEMQVLRLPLTGEVYEALGLTRANRKRDLNAACATEPSTRSSTPAACSRRAPHRRGRTPGPHLNGRSTPTLHGALTRQAGRHDLCAGGPRGVAPTECAAEARPGFRPGARNMRPRTGRDEEGHTSGAACAGVTPRRDP